MTDNFIGLDIGGANLKAADCQGKAISESFELWRRSDELADAIEAILNQWQDMPLRGVAVTMTGELADCYRTKREGVLHISSAVEEAVAKLNPRLDVSIYLTNGQFVSKDAISSAWELAAASNWHALASYAGLQTSDTRVLLVDIGSTTTDIIRTGKSGVTSSGRTDVERLATGELVYVGVERTPIPMLLQSVTYRGATLDIARELFATTLDCFLWTGEIEERPHVLATADGRPATREHAFARMSRLVCADPMTFEPTDADEIARASRDRQLVMIKQAIDRVIEDWGDEPFTIVWSGQADFLREEVVEQLTHCQAVLKLGDLIGPSASRCGPAYALAQLAKQCQDHSES